MPPNSKDLLKKKEKSIYKNRADSKKYTKIRGTRPKPSEDEDKKNRLREYVIRDTTLITKEIKVKIQR